MPRRSPRSRTRATDSPEATKYRKEVEFRQRINLQSYTGWMKDVPGLLPKLAKIERSPHLSRFEESSAKLEVCRNAVHKTKNPRLRANLLAMMNNMLKDMEHVNSYEGPKYRRKKS